MSTAMTLRDIFEQCRDMDASLNDRLQAFSDRTRALNSSFSQAVERLVERLRQNEAGLAAPGPGEPMPPFLLPDDQGRLVSLDEMLSRGPTAVIFHRGHWCPYCRISINAFSRAQKDITDAGGQIVAIMPERQQYAQEFKAEANASFPILTDVDNGYALSLNLVFWVGDEMQRLIAGSGRDVPLYQGNDAWMFPIPGTFVVGRDGIVRTRFVDPDYRKRIAIEDLLAALRGAT